MTTPFAIEEISIPHSIDDTDLVASVFVRNAGLIDILGPVATTITPAEMLPVLQDQHYERKRLFAARVDGQIVATAILVWGLAEDSRVVGTDISVLRAWRNRGIGTGLLDLVETESRAVGRSVMQIGAVHEAISGEMLPAPTGFGEVPLGDPAVRFLRKHGYALEQVYRISTLPLPVDEATLQGFEAEAWTRAGDDYRIHVWTGSSSERWRPDLAIIFARLMTDAPTGNLEVDPEPWDAERVRLNDERRIKSGRLALVAVAEHVPSGTLVAFNGISIPDAERTRPANQGMTLVLKEHRGHRLGMLVKAANIRQLMAVSPESPCILTDNAEENRPMLDVNEAVGFQAVAYEGVWQKTLTS